MRRGVEAGGQEWLRKTEAEGEANRREKAGGCGSGSQEGEVWLRQAGGRSHAGGRGVAETGRRERCG